MTPMNSGSFAGEHVGEVVEDRGLAADVDAHVAALLGGGDDVVAQPVDQVAGLLGLR